VLNWRAGFLHGFDVGVSRIAFFFLSRGNQKMRRPQRLPWRA